MFLWPFNAFNQKKWEWEAVTHDTNGSDTHSEHVWKDFAPSNMQVFNTGVKKVPEMLVN